MVLFARPRDVHDLLCIRWACDRRADEASGGRRPQPSVGRACLSFGRAEVFEQFERLLRVHVPITEPNDFAVHEAAVGQVQVRERALVLVLQPLVVLDTHGLAGDEAGQERFCFSTEGFDRLTRIDCLRRIHTDQPDRAERSQHHSVAIDDPLDAVRRLRGTDERRREQGSYRCQEVSRVHGGPYQKYRRVSEPPTQRQVCFQTCK